MKRNGRKDWRAEGVCFKFVFVCCFEDVFVCFDFWIFICLMFVWLVSI